MAKHLIAILQNPILRRQLGREAQRDVAARFSVTKRMRELRAVYAEIVR
jgi:glycosyltransferase involved in cell wall biosynthesis